MKKGGGAGEKELARPPFTPKKEGAREETNSPRSEIKTSEELKAKHPPFFILNRFLPCLFS